MFEDILGGYQKQKEEEMYDDGGHRICPQCKSNEIGTSICSGKMRRFCKCCNHEWAF